MHAMCSEMSCNWCIVIPQGLQQVNVSPSSMGWSKLMHKSPNMSWSRLMFDIPPWIARGWLKAFQDEESQFFQHWSLLKYYTVLITNKSIVTIQTVTAFNIRIWIQRGTIRITIKSITKNPKPIKPKTE